MIVIAHEDEGVQLHGIPLQGLRHELEKTSAIICAGKNPLPLITPASEVIERPSYSIRSGRAILFAYRKAQSSVKEFRLDPTRAPRTDWRRRFSAMQKEEALSRTKTLKAIRPSCESKLLPN